mgnify:CR=1 FL=1
MKISTTQRHYAVAAVIVLVAVSFWADFVRRYVQVSVIREQGSSESSGPEVNESAGWRAFFGHTGTDRAEFAVIRDRNVFSPARKAWASEGQDAGAASSVKADSPAERGDVQLLGVAFMGGDRKVILRTNPAGRAFTQSYGEGDVVSGPEGAPGLMFRVLEIGERIVRLEDSAGREFSVSLFGHEREEAEEDDGSIYTTPTPMVIVGDDDAGKGGGKSVENAQDGEDGEGYSEYSSEEDEMKNEQLVKDGKLKKIDTPFGPVYRKLE